MPVKIRLMRIGASKRPFYRVVAVDERKKRTGSYLELLGTYNPLSQPKEIILKQDRIDDWLKKGAQPSVGYLRIIGKAPQRQPAKPKKSQPKPAEESVPAESAKSAEQSASEPAEAEKSPEQTLPTDSTNEADTLTPTLPADTTSQAETAESEKKE